MSRQWEEPKHVREGRTGDGAAAPQYANRRDRNRVRRGKPQDVGKPGLIARLLGKKKKS